MDILRKKTDLKSLTKVANCSSIRNIFLLSSNVTRSLNATSLEKISGEIGFNGELLKRDGETFSAKVNHTLKGVSEGDEVAVEMSVEFIVVYALKPESDLSDDDLNNFCNTNALFNAWPFIREYVATMCSRMEIPPLTLPLLRIVPERKKKNPSKKKPDSDNTSEKS